jgi:hypothetical protein
MIVLRRKCLNLAFLSLAASGILPVPPRQQDERNLKSLSYCLWSSFQVSNFAAGRPSLGLRKILKGLNMHTCESPRKTYFENNVRKFINIGWLAPCHFLLLLLLQSL